MAGVATDSGSKGGRKSVDQQINMVPFIDLLVSLIAFLLMTAVWVHSGALVAQQPKGEATPEIPAPPVVEQLRVELGPTAFRVGNTAADIVAVPRGQGEYARLRAALEAQRRAHGGREVWVQPDSAVPYNDVARVMDVIYDVWGATGSPSPDALPVTVRML